MKSLYKIPEFRYRGQSSLLPQEEVEGLTKF